MPQSAVLLLGMQGTESVDSCEIFGCPGGSVSSAVVLFCWESEILNPSTVAGLALAPVALYTPA